jgi:hypothetical protein
MFGARGRHHPTVHASFVDRHGGCRKCRIGKCADGNGNPCRVVFGHVIYGRAAYRAEVKARARALIAGADVAGRLSRHRHFRAIETGLLGERAAGAALAGQAMADRDAHRILGRPGSELAATARGKTRWHGDSRITGYDTAKDIPPRTLMHRRTRLSDNVFNQTNCLQHDHVCLNHTGFDRCTGAGCLPCLESS